MMARLRSTTCKYCRFTPSYRFLSSHRSAALKSRSPVAPTLRFPPIQSSSQAATRRTTPSFNFSIYGGFKKYPMPGPAVWEAQFPLAAQATPALPASLLFLPPRARTLSLMTIATARARRSHVAVALSASRFARSRLFQVERIIVSRLISFEIGQAVCSQLKFFSSYTILALCSLEHLLYTV
ncbi:lytic polysaccharide monooxygenase [Macroventuria anomochaeta]|uniref:Lytic polysaccharide monooxygenase n=1 Tax=Macroventuria anomochaeta TaxID=301207 RepID=A0ACB6SK57_9PLEO|nr:lytic polysaccharide monooxygenase [Macroventuria anomochaeta]KAF2633959.1 lytic polysaccharide monooxygenase [Macroventuria anomochaeta]